MDKMNKTKGSKKETSVTSMVANKQFKVTVETRKSHYIHLNIPNEVNPRNLMNAMDKNLKNFVEYAGYDFRSITNTQGNVIYPRLVFKFESKDNRNVLSDILKEINRTLEEFNGKMD